MGILVATLSPSLLTLGLAPMTSTTFSMVVGDVLEVIGGFMMPPLLFLQLVLATVQGHKGQPNGSLDNCS